jgi:hypothetical protein
MSHYFFLIPAFQTQIILNFILFFNSKLHIHKHIYSVFLREICQTQYEIHVYHCKLIRSTILLSGIYKSVYLTTLSIFLSGTPIYTEDT